MQISCQKGAGTKMYKCLVGHRVGTIIWNFKTMKYQSIKIYPRCHTRKFSLTYTEERLS